MIAFVTHSSALWFIRRYGSLVSCASVESFSPSKCASSARGVTSDVFGEYGFPEPLHLSCENGIAARSNSALRFHRTAALPPAAFRRIDSTFAVASPELVFLQMAGRYQLPHLVMLGYELCGAYSLDKTYDEGFSRHEQMTNVAQIEAFLSDVEQIDAVRYVNRARRALRYVADNSFSPKETEVSALLCMPQMEGGFGLPLPELNHEIRLCKEAKRIYPVSFCMADLCWPRVKLCVEYDSDAVHASVEQLNKDSARRNALELTGFRVVTITKRQLYSQESFIEVAHLIAKCIGKRIQIRSSYFPEKHAELRKCVLGSRTGVGRSW